MIHYRNLTTANLPPSMPQCHCGEGFRDAGYKIESVQFPNLYQCATCGGFTQLKSPFPPDRFSDSSRSAPSLNESGLHPLKHAVLISPYEVEEMTKGGILLPSQVVERDQLSEQRGIIIEVGALADIGDASVGDKILFSKWSGQTAIGTLDGKVYRVVNDRDIFLRIEDNVNLDETSTNVSG